MLIQTIKLLCVRDSKTKIVTTVLAHEVPILKLIHGVENILPMEEGNPCEVEPEDELQRLNQKYGSDVVTDAFGKLAGDRLHAALSQFEVKKTKTKAPKAKDSDPADVEVSEEA